MAISVSPGHTLLDLRGGAATSIRETNNEQTFRWNFQQIPTGGFARKNFEIELTGDTHLILRATANARNRLEDGRTEAVHDELTTRLLPSQPLNAAHPSVEPAPPPSVEPTPSAPEATEAGPANPAPRLSINVSGPEPPNEEGAETYRIYVTNLDDLPVGNVKVAAFFRSVHSPATASIKPDSQSIDKVKACWRLYWSITRLEPRQGYEILLPIQRKGDEDLGLSVAANADIPGKSGRRTPTVRATAEERHAAPTPVGPEANETRPTSPGPRLSISVVGSERPNEDGATPYYINVLNLGDLPAREVGVGAFFDSEHWAGAPSIAPAGQAVAHEKSLHQIYWNFPLIGPRQFVQIILPIHLEGDKDLRLSASVSAADPGNEDRRMPDVSTTLRDSHEPTLLVDTTGPRRVARNGEISYQVVVRNTGKTVQSAWLSSWVSDGHTARDPEDPTTTTPEHPNGTSSLEWDLFSIPAGGSVQKNLIVKASGGDDLVITSCVSTHNRSLDQQQPTDIDELTVQVVPDSADAPGPAASNGPGIEPPPAAEAPSAPKLAVKITGPRKVARGLGVNCTVRVYNDGTSPAEDVSVTAYLTPGVSVVQEPQAIDPSASIVQDENTGQQRISWNIPRLEPGEARHTELTVRLADHRTAELTVQADARDDSPSGRTVAATDRFASHVAADADVRIFGPSDTTLKVGEQRILEFQVTNAGELDAENIRIEFDGSELVKVIPGAQDGAMLVPNAPERGALPPIDRLTSHTVQTFRLRVAGLKPGLSEFVVHALWDDAEDGGQFGKVFDIRVGEPVSPPAPVR